MRGLLAPLRAACKISRRDLDPAGLRGISFSSQSVNMPGVMKFGRVLQDRSLLVPHAALENISELSFK